MNPALNTIGGIFLLALMKHRGSKSTIPEEVSPKDSRLYDWKITFDLIRIDESPPGKWYFNNIQGRSRRNEKHSPDWRDRAFLRHPFFAPLLEDTLRLDLWLTNERMSLLSAQSLRQVLGIPRDSKVDISVKREHPEEWGPFRLANSKTGRRMLNAKGTQPSNAIIKTMERIAKAGLRKYQLVDYSSPSIINEMPTAPPLLPPLEVGSLVDLTPRGDGDSVRDDIARLSYGSNLKYLWSDPLPLKVEIKFKSLFNRIDFSSLFSKHEITADLTERHPAMYWGHAWELGYPEKAPEYQENEHFEIIRVKFIDFERLYHSLGLRPINLQIFPEKGYPNRDVVRRR